MAYVEHTVHVPATRRTTINDAHREMHGDDDDESGINDGIYTSSPFLVFLQYLSLGNYGNPPDDNRTTTKDDRRTTKDDSDIWREARAHIKYID